jgi:hypothetical protein
VLAAIALADRLPDQGDAILREVVEMVEDAGCPPACRGPACFATRPTLRTL